MFIFSMFQFPWFIPLVLAKIFWKECYSSTHIHLFSNEIALLRPEMSMCRFWNSIKFQFTASILIKHLVVTHFDFTEFFQANHMPSWNKLSTLLFCGILLQINHHSLPKCFDNTKKSQTDKYKETYTEKKTHSKSWWE